MEVSHGWNCNFCNRLSDILANVCKLPCTFWDIKQVLRRAKDEDTHQELTSNLGKDETCCTLQIQLLYKRHVDDIVMIVTLSLRNFVIKKLKYQGKTKQRLPFSIGECRLDVTVENSRPTLLFSVSDISFYFNIALENKSVRRKMINITHTQKLKDVINLGFKV